MQLVYVCRTVNFCNVPTDLLSLSAPSPDLPFFFSKSVLSACARVLQYRATAHTTPLYWAPAYILEDTKSSFLTKI